MIVHRKNNLILIQGKFFRPKQKHFCFERVRLVIPTISQDFNHGRQQRSPKSSISGTIYVEDDSEVAIEARAKDMTLIIERQNKETRASWSSFNQRLTNANQEITTIGYMPIIQAPAHDMDTLNTVVRRCMYVTSKLGQQYTVLTVDQALYYKLMDLKWSIPEYKDKLIPRLGGLHISINLISQGHWPTHERLWSL